MCTYFPDLPVLQSGFEGCEKRLFISFDGRGDLRELGMDTWRRILEDAKCSILNIVSNNTFYAYLLSESSLFVYSQKMMIKTCGTTTLLQCLPLLLKHAREMHLLPTHISYSRSNFMFPQAQPHIHRSFETETHYLNTLFDGSAVVLGPLFNSRWHVYTAGVFRPRIAEKSLEVVMFDLDHSKMKCFFKDNLPTDKSDTQLAEYVTRQSGIKDLLPRGTVIDAYMFDPCGYSLNGLLDDTYFTIHITPEKEASFVSFETNLPQQCYADLLDKVLTTFKPDRFGVAISSTDGNFHSTLRKWQIDGFDRKNYSSHYFSKCHHIVSANFSSASIDSTNNALALDAWSPYRQSTTSDGLIGSVSSDSEDSSNSSPPKRSVSPLKMIVHPPLSPLSSNSADQPPYADTELYRSRSMAALHHSTMGNIKDLKLDPSSSPIGLDRTVSSDTLTMDAVSRLDISSIDSTDDNWYQCLRVKHQSCLREAEDSGAAVRNALVNGAIAPVVAKPKPDDTAKTQLKSTKVDVNALMSLTIQALSELEAAQQLVTSEFQKKEMSEKVKSMKDRLMCICTPNDNQS